MKTPWKASTQGPFNVPGTSHEGRNWQISIFDDRNAWVATARGYTQEECLDNVLAIVQAVNFSFGPIWRGSGEKS